MAGELDLGKLLSSLEAVLADGIYVFATLDDKEVPNDLSPRMIFREEEGTTLIILETDAKAAGLNYEFPCRMITLNVHSSLEAVGFMARIATALAAEGMGVNPVAGFYHDPLVVPEDRAADAMAVLERISGR